MSSSLLCMMLLIIFMCRSQWISYSGNDTLPRADERMAIGSYNRSIFIIGGWVYGYQLVEYRIDTGAFIDHNQYVLPAYTYGTSSFYTQIDHELYMIDPAGTSFNIFNMETNAFTENWDNVVFPVGVYDTGCLTFSASYLYVVGGWNNSYDGYLNTVQILNLSTKEWLNDTPSMLTKRKSCSCIIHPSSPSSIFAIGGYNANEYSLKSIEEINITSLTSKYVGDLTSWAVSTRSIIHGLYIYVIGGWWYSGSWHYVDTVHAINPINGEVSLLDDRLSYGVHSFAAITIKDALYVFGGYSYGTQLDSWMKYELPTTSPSNDPTEIPSISSTSPTNNPSQTPSTYPSSSPSQQLTVYVSPSNEPTEIPTEIPSASSISPTYIPSQTPSVAATDIYDICSYVCLEIVNLEGISAYDFSQSYKLKSFITNTTKYGIHHVGIQNGINNEDSYYTEFEGASGNINISQKICAFTQMVLDVVFTVIQGQSNKIEAFIQHKLVIHFENNDHVNTDNMNVTISLQQADTSTNRDNSKVSEIPSLWIGVGIITLFLLFSIASLIDAKCWRQSDYFRIWSIITASLEVLDTTLDFLFAVFLTMHYYIYGGIEFLIAMSAAYLFIIIPISHSIIQLIIKSRKTWFKDDNLRRWLTDNAKILYLLSVLTGSSYTAINIVNSNAFQVDMFCMGLNKQQKIRFDTKRIWGVIFLENIPQITIQIWYLTKIGLDITPLLSIIFSCVSIILSVLSLYTQKTIIRNQQFENISFDVIGNDIKPKLSLKTDSIKSEIAALLKLNVKLIEIPRPQRISQGLTFEIYLFVNDNGVDNKGYKSMISHVALSEIIKKQWNVNNASINNLKIKKIQSQIQQKNASNTEQIELTNTNDTHFVAVEDNDDSN